MEIVFFVGIIAGSYGLGKLAYKLSPKFRRHLDEMLNAEEIGKK